MSELLAPAGSYEAFIAAVSNGCDAVYLALEKFGARAYANNFSIDELKKVIEYAHLRNVKIYVTMNTIVYDHELSEAYEQIDLLEELGVDGIIIQDLALLDYVNKRCKNTEAHASTQVGIDDLYAIKFFEDFKIDRCVVAREIPYEELINIKKNSKMSIEAFIHGALCVSYSGNCLMSGLIGFRSGNRGRCVGSCRKNYKLINKFDNTIISNNYILSMKDLCSVDNIEKMKIVDSLKIEGRMKEPSFVANTVKSYRDLLDNNTTSSIVKNNIIKTFNRTFTKGYTFKEDKKDIVNVTRPNHSGYLIGTVIKKVKNGYMIKLDSTLNQNDQIRIDNKEEVNLKVVKLFDKSLNLINSASDYCIIEIKEKVELGDKVYKTKDIELEKSLEKTYPKEFKRFPIDVYLNGEINQYLSMTVRYEDIYVTSTSDYIIEKSNNILNKENLLNQISRLNDTPYIISDLILNVDDYSFIPNKVINTLRRDVINLLNEERLKVNSELFNYSIKPISFQRPTTKQLTVFCNTQEQYKAAVDLDVDIIYYKDNVFRRNDTKFKECNNSNILIGGYNGINYFKPNNNLVTDFSFNVVNNRHVNILHNLGIKRVTLSHEINKTEINELVENYVKENNGYPSLELIVYGRQDLMHTNYCPLKTNNLCGLCRKSNFAIKDDFEEFPIMNHMDCSTTVLNSKTLNLLDDLNEIDCIDYYRLQFTIEDYEETKSIIELAINKIYNNSNTKSFNDKLHTRAHFNKKIL
ncbi:MAG: DUF3656 domain-containing U32 family peptidase [Anaeroplasmataceae bacterium]